MANDLDDFVKNIENLKVTVRKSFAKIYASLKARELKTLRQLDALCKQCEDDNDLKRNCVQNICVSYENEVTLLSNISNYGVIDLEKLNFVSNTFTLEDYVTPEDDHMYSYKTIGDLTEDVCSEDISAIEEAALKEITSTVDCVCYVNIKSEDVHKQFQKLHTSSPIKDCENDSRQSSFDKGNNSLDSMDEKSDSIDADIKKVEPTDDWLNSIKSQTETEPSQVTDVMEHSTIACL